MQIRDSVWIVRIVIIVIIVIVSNAIIVILLFDCSSCYPSPTPPVCFPEEPPRVPSSSRPTQSSCSSQSDTKPLQLPEAPGTSLAFWCPSSSPSQTQEGASQSPVRVKSAPPAATQWEEDRIARKSCAELPQTSSWANARLPDVSTQRRHSKEFQRGKIPHGKIVQPFWRCSTMWRDPLRWRPLKTM